MEEEDTIDVIPSTPLPIGTALGETLETSIEIMDDINIVDASLVARTEERDTFASQMLKMEKEASDSLNFFSI